MLAVAGVYIAGGIAPKILPALKRPAFCDAFAGKGRLKAFLETVPVLVVTSDRVALLGAAGAALSIQGSSRARAIR